MRRRIFGRRLAVVLIIISVVILAGGLTAGKPQRLRVGNVGSRAVTVSWVTSRPGRSCVWLRSSSSIFRPGRRVCPNNRRANVHSVEITELAAETKYQFWVKSGFFSRKIEATTEPVPEEVPPLPNPAYGQVVLDDGITLAKDINVFIQVGGKLLSTVTPDFRGEHLNPIAFS